MDKPLTALCTCPDEETATRLSRGLVESRLAACVNILPGTRSLYAWEGEIEDETEVLMIIKTFDQHMPAISRYLDRHHPYEVPELVGMPVKFISDDYRKWLAESVDE